MYTNAELTKTRKAKSKKKDLEGSSEYSSIQFDKQKNQTGIPDNMKSDFEITSGFSFDDVKVNYNSDKPAQMNAKAYAKGNEVFLGSGEEQSLPHELGHIVQQKKGIVDTTETVGGVNLNTDSAMEKNADDIAKSANGKGVVQGDWKDYTNTSFAGVGALLGIGNLMINAVGLHGMRTARNAAEAKEQAQANLELINTKADEAVAANDACNDGDTDKNKTHAEKAVKAANDIKTPLDALKASYEKDKENAVLRTIYSKAIASAKRACNAAKEANDAVAQVPPTDITFLTNVLTGDDYKIT